MSFPGGGRIEVDVGGTNEIGKISGGLTAVFGLSDLVFEPFVVEGGFLMGG